MKANGFNKMSFGFSSVNAGQRNQTVEPQLVVVSTEGNFRITPPVSKALNIGHGDYVMFINNLNNIDQAITNGDDVVKNFCEENGLELGSAEAAIAIHKEFDMWAIAKGIVEYDTKGNIKTMNERLTKNDKIRFVSQNFDAMLAAASEQADDEVKDALTREGITKEEQIDILTAFVTPREIEKFKGSKAANAAGLTGSGTSLTFTDSNVWKQMKADMGDDATVYNRVYDIDVDDIQDIQLHNGYEYVTVKALVLGDYTDKAPVRVGKSDEE